MLASYVETYGEFVVWINIFMTVVLPPGDNPIAVNKYIV